MGKTGKFTNQYFKNPDFISILLTRGTTIGLVVVPFIQSGYRWVKTA